MKKKTRIIIFSLLVLVGVLFLGTGGKVSDAFLANYEISAAGSEMTLQVGIESSMGYLRTFKAKDDGNKKYITFYSTYGLNSNIGAKNEFHVELQPSCDEIYFYSDNGEFKLILRKNGETNEWEVVR